jgi:DNA (cytosine-5)-methyltransferase 1
MNIFDFMYENFKFKQDEIKLIELFAGIGSQAIALDKLAAEFDFKLNVLGVSEIDKYAIQSYNAIHGDTHNFGNIMDIKELPYTDILTYSFPCQDISLAGRGKGFTKGSGTRSGLLWEVERILDKQKEIEKLPQVLLMENVKALANQTFKDDFIKWQLKLQELGYSNYWEILNAKNYGIPQNRERVFMVSILGEWNYTFPKLFPLKLRLKDMLEDEVDEKFYLSDKMIKFFQSNTKKQKEKGNGFKFEPQDGNENAKSITTKSGSRMDDNFIQTAGIINKKGLHESCKRVLDIGVVVKGNYSPSNHNASRVVDEKGIAPTQTTECGTTTSSATVLINNNLRIRKLIPLETWRLMGFNDEQFNKAASVCSNSQLYRQSGNSIVVDVLYYIFKELIK